MDGLCDIERDVLYYIYVNEPCTIDEMLEGMDALFENRDETRRAFDRLKKKRYVSVEDTVLTTTDSGEWFLDGKQYPKHIEILRLLAIGEYYPAILGFKIGIQKPFTSEGIHAIRAWKQRLLDGTDLVSRSRGYVDPRRIETRMNKQIFDTEYHRGVIKGGDWDRLRSDFRSHPVFVGLRQRFEEGRCWESTNYVRWAELGIEAVGQRFGYTSVDDFVENRCSYIDDLYRSIEENGYMEHRNTRISDSNTDQGADVSICIDREGECLLYDGHHRATIARLLGVDEIPVNVLVCHDDWQGVTGSLSTEGMDRSAEPEQSPLLGEFAE